MDHNVTAAVRFVADEEDMNTHLCVETVKVNGHTAEEADMCDDFSVGCEDCPFRK